MCLFQFNAINYSSALEAIKLSPVTLKLIRISLTFLQNCFVWRTTFQSQNVRPQLLIDEQTTTGCTDYFIYFRIYSKNTVFSTSTNWQIVCGFRVYLNDFLIKIIFMKFLWLILYYTTAIFSQIISVKQNY